VEAKTFHFELLTPQRQVLACEAASVVLPAADGLLGVLHNRAAFAAALGDGKLTIAEPKGTHRYRVSVGAAHMSQNTLIILAENCTPLS